MEVFQETRALPKDEHYSFTDQIRRSSRSVAANIAEGFRKRQYPKMFLSKLADADGQAGGLTDVLPEAGVLPGFAVIFFSVGVWRFRYE